MGKKRRLMEGTKTEEGKSKGKKKGNEGSITSSLLNKISPGSRAEGSGRGTEGEWQRITRRLAV